MAMHPTIWHFISANLIYITLNKGNGVSTDINEKTKMAAEKDMSPAFKHQN